MSNVADSIALHLYRFRDGAETEAEAVKAIARVVHEHWWDLEAIYKSPEPSPQPSTPTTNDTPAPTTNDTKEPHTC